MRIRGSKLRGAGRVATGRLIHVVYLIVGNAPSNFDCSRMNKRGLPGYRGIGDT